MEILLPQTGGEDGVNYDMRLTELGYSQENELFWDDT